MEIRRVRIVAHESKPNALERYEQLAALLADRSIEVSEADPDLVVSLGGDGTMLRAAKAAHAADVPLLGINLGTLGYLTEVDPGGERSALESILSGNCDLEHRMMLSCNIRGGDDGAFVALNEVLVERASRHRLVRLVVSIGGESLAAFNADGVLVATPTGSTAYALSAGGPLVSPRAACLVLVPVNAHMIFSRPFVLAPDETVEITCPEAEEPASLALDGAMGSALARDATVVVRRDPRPLKLLRVSGPGFIARLRRKLNLPA